MANTEAATVIKKYANRRLYNTGTSTYVTLEDLAAMVKSGEDFVVYDAKTGDDITHSVLTQIIVEQENKGQNLLPIAFLRQLIRFYGDQMQAIVPSYLDQSLAAFAREQDKFRKGVAEAFGGTPFGPTEDQVRRNMEMFDRAMRMFIPFGGGTGPETRAAPDAAPEPAPRPSDLERLREQIEAMQRKIDAIAGSGSGAPNGGPAAPADPKVETR